jgi:hypothetical protein
MKWLLNTIDLNAMEKIVEVKAIEKFKIHVWFQDGVNGVVDLSDMANFEVFKEWHIEDGFNKVEINPESEAPTWPGGGDLDPLNLYLTLIGRTYEEYRAFKRLDKVA